MFYRIATLGSTKVLFYVDGSGQVWGSVNSDGSWSEPLNVNLPFDELEKMDILLQEDLTLFATAFVREGELWKMVYGELGEEDWFDWSNIEFEDVTPLSSDPPFNAPLQMFQDPTYLDTKVVAPALDFIDTFMYKPDVHPQM